MASYVVENLLVGERVVYRASLSRWAYFGSIFWGVLLTPLVIGAVVYGSAAYPQQVNGWRWFWPVAEGAILAALLVSAINLVSVWVKFHSTELAVTDRRVIAKSGFIRRETFELNVDRVEGIQVSQGVVARLFGYGTLRIAGAGNADPIPDISHPIAFKKAVMESQRAARGG